MEAKRKRTKNIIIAAVLVAVAILMAALPAMLSSGQKEENTGTAKSVAVQRGNIDSTVAGAGTLSGGDGVKITVPHGVEITEYLVANGDVVAEGQALATVDKTSVMNTIATVQNNLEYLAGQVRTAASGATNAYLAAPAAGRVKAIYANAGDDVQSVIREHGALMVVSLDGRMAVDAETASDAATPGKSVTVRCEDGTEYAGRIEIRRGNTLTVTLTDNGPALAAKADILLDGETVGTGTLYAHSAWNVTAAAGTVAGVNTAVERQITQGATVLTLRDVDAEGEYRRLSQLHRDYEDTMLKLFRLYQTGTVTASAAGRVSDLDTAHLGVMRNTGSYTAALLASPSEGVPEEYTVRPALLSEVTFGSMTFLAAPAAADVDLTAEPVVDTESAESIPVTSFDGVSVYDWDADASDWAGDVHHDEIGAGNGLLHRVRHMGDAAAALAPDAGVGDHVIVIVQRFHARGGEGEQAHFVPPQREVDRGGIAAVSAAQNGDFHGCVLLFGCYPSARMVASCWYGWRVPVIIRWPSAVTRTSFSSW